MITSFDFARLADVVYSEVISKNEYKKLKIKNINIISENFDYLFYKLNSFNLKSGDVIYTHTGNLLNLFTILKNVPEDFELSLITHQSDRPINNALFSMKPKCIKRWYGINIDYLSNILHPIPLGIANENYKNKNLVKSELVFPRTDSFFMRKKNLLYVNFSIQTNYSERSWVKQYFKKFPWAVVEEEQLSLNEYKNKIKNSNFVLCPWGNGIDSHRIWETLSVGSIPIVKDHVTFKTLDFLPFLSVEDFKLVNENLLKETLINLKEKEYNFSKLDIEFWSKEIRNNTSANSLEIEIQESLIISKIYLIKGRINSFKTKKMKKLQYYFRKISKVFKLITSKYENK